MIVVDASVAGKWLFPHELRAPQALALLTESTRQRDPILARTCSRSKSRTSSASG
jgi:hypothetical protein